MKAGDKIIIKKNVSFHHVKGKIVAPIPGTNFEKYIIQIGYFRPILLTLEASEFLRKGGKRVVLDQFCIEQGSDGVILREVSHSHYLCEFGGPPCLINLAKNEIINWNPQVGVFALLNTVKVIEDIPEHNLKKGAEGVIILVFFDPYLAYDVEFFLGEDSAEQWDSYTLLPHQIEFVSERP